MAFPTDWGRRCAVVIDNTKVTLDGSDFPVSIDKDMLPSEMFDADGTYPALNGGGDVRFSSDSAGTVQLNLEVVTFVTDNDPANGVAELWVKVPSISSSVDTTIYVWYNKAAETQPAASATGGSEGVWPAKYETTLHMDEDPSSSDQLDSTANGHNYTCNNMEIGDLVPGKIGNCLSFQPATAEYINRASEYCNGSTGMTWQCWVNLTSAASQFLFDQRESSTGVQPGHLDNSGNLQFYSSDTGNSGRFGSGLSTSTWYKIDLVLGGGNITMYVNGTTTYSKADNEFNFGTKNMYIATRHSVGSALDGLVDEFRLLNEALSAEWIETEYNNQNDHANFAAAGTPESPGGPTGRPLPQRVLTGPFSGPFKGSIRR